MDIQIISRKKFLHTVWWALLGSLLIISIVATLGRASMNFNAALTDKPDIAIYLLLPGENIRETKLLRDSGDERHYLAETEEGPKLIILKRGPEEWFVEYVEKLRD